MNLQCSCTGQTLTRLDDSTLVAGQVDKIIVAFGVSEEWGGMTIVARFCRDLQNEIYDVELNSDYEAEIPHEVMDSAGTFQMSLRGEKDNRAITSNTVSYQVLDTILGPGVSPADPSMTIYDKIATSEEIKTASVNAIASATSAKNSESVAKSSAESASASAVAAKTYSEATYASAGNVLKKNVSGTVVHVDDSFKGGKLKGFRIKGKSVQNTTTGKNLLDSKALIGRSSIYSLNDNYDVVMSSPDQLAWTTITSYCHLDAGTYTFSVGSNQSIEYIVNGEDSVKTVTSTTTVVFNSDVEVKLKLNPINSATYPVTMKCQIEKGSTATEYEPYTGGKPSPSPEYPQKIKVINNKIEAHIYGANIFDNTRLKYTGNYAGKKYDPVTGIISAINKKEDQRGWTIGYSDYIFDLPKSTMLHVKIEILKPSSNSTDGKIRVFHNGKYGSSKEYNDYSLSSVNTIEFDKFFSNNYSGFLFKLYDGEIRISCYIKDTEYNYSTSWKNLSVELPSDHPYLASLPDGTYDELIIDESGNSKIIARVSSIDLNDSSNQIDIGNNKRYDIRGDKINCLSKESNSISVLCNNLRSCGDDSWLGKYEYSSSAMDYRSPAGVCVVLDQDPSLDKFEKFISEYSSKIMFRLASPVEYIIDPVDMPIQPDSILNTWIYNQDNDLIPEFSITYERDINMVISNLEISKEQET